MAGRFFVRQRAAARTRPNYSNNYWRSCRTSVHNTRVITCWTRACARVIGGNRSPDARTRPYAKHVQCHFNNTNISLVRRPRNMINGPRLEPTESNGCPLSGNVCAQRKSVGYLENTTGYSTVKRFVKRPTAACTLWKTGHIAHDLLQRSRWTYGKNSTRFQDGLIATELKNVRFSKPLHRHDGNTERAVNCFRYGILEYLKRPRKSKKNK